MFLYSDSNKRYHTLDYYYKHKYGCKVCKICFNIGCSCPNIDGSKGYGGCIYCKNGSGDFAGDPNFSLQKQYENQIKIMLNKWPKAKFIAYFQAGTNTYGNLDYLKECYEKVLTFDNIIGIHIATRCDAISLECLEYLKILNKKTNLTIELGLQTIHEETSKLINRGHSLDEFVLMFKKLKNANINTVVHIINGLPYESKEMMIDTVSFLNNLGISGIKIHMLSILKGTAMETFYNKNKFHLLTKEEYIDIVINQLELLDPCVVIHRITGDPTLEDLVAPTFLIKKTILLNDIDKEMVKRDTFQGKKS